MIAEIKGKISRSGSNLNDRLEDKLTGDFFGSLRYIPFNLVLGKVLSNSVYPKSIADEIEKIDAEFWSDKILFWPYHREGEIDVLLDFDNVTIGIEVKYLSGLSSDDDGGISYELGEDIQKDEDSKSCNQLARESRIVSEMGKDKTKILLFIASSHSCIEVYEDITSRAPSIIESDVMFGYISWQRILEELSKIKLEDLFYQTIISDLILLLERKGFDGFKDMNVSLDKDIAKDEFYKFSVSGDSNLNFDTKVIVDGGLYYEFK